MPLYLNLALDHGVKRLEQLGRKAVRQVVENVFARRDVDLDVAPFFGCPHTCPPIDQQSGRIFEVI
jgi:hypothetical protein